MTRHRHIIALVLGAAALAACGDSGQTNITAPTAGARVLFVNEAVGAPGVNFFADTAKVTAVLTSAGTPSPVGTGYGQMAAGGYYTQIAAGQHTLAAKTADTTTGKSNLTVSSASTTLAAGNWYSYYQSGLYSSATGQADAFVVQDQIPDTWDYTVANVRFVNAIANSGPGTLTVKDSTGKATTVGTATAYKSASAYVPVPVGPYSVSVSGLRATAVTRGNVNLVGGRYYTIAARGDATVSSGTNAPTLDFQENR